MPMFPDPEPDNPGFRSVTGRTPTIEPFQDPTGAAFRQSNSIVSLANSLYNMGSFAPEQGYSSWDDIKDTKYFQDHAMQFAGSSSRAETQSIKRRIDAEEADRRALASSGAAGVIAGLAAGALDPTMLMPSGMALKVGKEGWALGKAALGTGAAFGAQAAVQEGALQASQLTRPLGESALNVATGTLLGAIIGPGAAKLLSRGERAALEKELAADRAAMNEHTAPTAGNVVEFPKKETEPAASPPVEPTIRGYRDTRGQGTKFHGSGSEVTALDEGHYGSSVAYYGTQGLYTSEALDVAHGYAHRKGAKQPTIYEVQENKPTKIYNMEEPIAPEIMPVIKAMADDPHGYSGELVGGALEDNPKNLRELFDNVREIATSERIPADEVQESVFHPIMDALSEQGYHGMSHRGGLRTKTPEHQVTIYFNPAETVRLRKMSEAEITGLRPGEKPAAPIPGDMTPPSMQAVGAAATDTRKLEQVPTGPLARTVADRLGPVQRNLAAQSVEARRVTVDLAETPRLFKENLEGIPTTQGPALEREARMAITQTRVSVFDENMRLFSDYRFGKEDISFPRTRAAWGDLTGNTEGKMSWSEFKAEISKAMQEGDQHAIPQVQAAAQHIRKTVFDPWKERAIAAGLLSEDVDVKTAESYFQRLYNKQAIAAKRDDFVGRVTDWLASDQATKAQTKDRLTGYSKELERLRGLIDKAERKGIDDDFARNQHASWVAQHDALRAKIEKEIADWEGTTTAAAKSAIKAREKYAAENPISPVLLKQRGRLESADKAVDKAVEDIIASDRELSREELRSRAHEITDRILGSPDGRLPYDIASGGPEIGVPGARGMGDNARGPLAHRDFMIPDATIRDFLEQDVEHVIDAHLRTMVPDTLLAEKFGDVRMTETFRKINDEYAALTDAAKTEKERRALEKERQNVLTDVAAIRDRLRGVYGFSTDAPTRQAARIVRAVKNYNVLTSMGVAALSSLPDMAGSVMRHGLVASFNDAWAPFFSYMVGASDAWKEGGRQIRAMGIATETLLANRHHELNDIMDSYRPQSRVERALQWGADRFQLANLLGPWTDWAKINASLVAGSEILRAAEAVTKGTASARHIRTLAENGIDAHMATRIHEAFQAGGEVRDGVHLPNTGDWTDASARRAFEGAVGREADIAVVTPGQEKALWLSNPVLGVFGQFKSFTAGATERILIANLQRRDAQVLSGIMFSMGLGMVSYRINALTGGQPVSDKPGDWVKEGLSRGNVLGWLEEGNALASKASGGSVDAYRMLGSGKPLSRYQSRSAMDQLLGPTAGKIDSLLKVTSAAGRRDWNEGDTKALRRLTAGQNLVYLRKLFDQVEIGANNAFHIEMKPKPVPKH